MLGTKESQLRNPGSLPLVHCAFWFCGGLTPIFPTASAVGFHTGFYSFCGGLHYTEGLFSLNLCIGIDFSANTSSSSSTARFLQVDLSLEINFVYNTWIFFCTVDVLNFAGPIFVHCHFHSDLGLQQVLHWYP